MRSVAEAVIDVRSLDTRHGDRDAHLKSALFLDGFDHPTIRFRSRRIPHGPTRWPARARGSDDLLEEEGIEKFAASFNKLLVAIANRLRALRATVGPGSTYDKTAPPHTGAKHGERLSALLLRFQDIGSESCQISE